jgi:hypothetical protein
MDDLLRKKTLLCVYNTIVILAMTGCQTPVATAASPDSPTPAAKIIPTQQFIIKFKPGTFACDTEGIAQLSSTTQVPLEFVRPMSGEACVIRQPSGDEDELVRSQQLLKQHPAVEWLERDAKKRAL